MGKLEYEDWEVIADKLKERGLSRSGEECQNYWNSACRSTVNRSDWTAAESSQLRTLADKYKEHYVRPS